MTPIAMQINTKGEIPSGGSLLVFDLSPDPSRRQMNIELCVTNVNCDDIDYRFQFYYLLEMALKLSTMLVYRLCNLRTLKNEFLNETNSYFYNF